MDGTSLTVCDVNRADSTFTFMLIPYTQQHIIVPKKAVGQRWVWPRRDGSCKAGWFLIDGPC